MKCENLYDDDDFALNHQVEESKRGKIVIVSRVKRCRYVIKFNNAAPPEERFCLRTRKQNTKKKCHIIITWAEKLMKAIWPNPFDFSAFSPLSPFRHSHSSSLRHPFCFCSGHFCNVIAASFTCITCIVFTTRNYFSCRTMWWPTIPHSASTKRSKWQITEKKSSRQSATQ